MAEKRDSWQWAIGRTKRSCGELAALKGAELIRETIARRGSCNIVVATGASQLEMLECLVQCVGIDWSKVTCFHLDEYLGLPEDHPASFVGYLRKRFLNKLPVKPAAFFFVDGMSAAVEHTLTRLGEVIKKHPVDVAFIGIGENGHLAFNDPPADFETEQPFLTVELAESCRRQQLGEGWFETLEDVPKRAITMSISQIMSSQHLVVTVPEERKAAAVRSTMTGPVQASVPATILQQHKQCYMFFDQDSAPELSTLK